MTDYLLPGPRDLPFHDPIARTIRFNDHDVVLHTIPWRDHFKMLRAFKRLRRHDERMESWANREPVPHEYDDEPDF